MRLHEQCPVCELKFLQNQGDLFGPLVLLDRVLFLIPLIVAFYFGVFNPSTAGLLVFGGITVFLLIYTMPNRNGVSLAIDYFIRHKEDNPA